MWSGNHFIKADLVNYSPWFFSQRLNSLFCCFCLVLVLGEQLSNDYSSTGRGNVGQGQTQ